MGLTRTPRAVAATALALATLALLAVLFGPGRGSYEVVAQFRDAGQLVKGGTVQVGGRRVGTIKEIRLSDDGLAEVVMALEDPSVDPLRVGTSAQVRTLGLSGIANRYVELAPGPASGAEIPDGGRLALTRTTSIVDLDAVLGSLDPQTRMKLGSLLDSGGRLFGPGDARAANRVLRYLNPAVGETRALTEQLTQDKQALSTLLRTGARTARVLAAHDEALGRGLTGTATTLRTLADERAALGSILERAPAAQRRMARSLDTIASSFAVLRPATRDLSAASPTLAALLRRLPPATEALRPVLADLRRTLPSLDTTLRRLPGLADAARPALGSATSAVRGLTPIIRGLRPYAPDAVAGLFNGFGGTAGNTYDANGHVGRIASVTGGGGATGLLSLLNGPGGAAGPLVPQTRRFARCPGTGAIALGDGSNDPSSIDPTLCDPRQTRP